MLRVAVPVVLLPCWCAPPELQKPSMSPGCCAAGVHNDLLHHGVAPSVGRSMSTLPYFPRTAMTAGGEHEDEHVQAGGTKAGSPKVFFLLDNED